MAEINVRFPPHLRRFIDLPASCTVQANNISQLIDELESEFKGIRIYLLHENGELRQHVNLFVDGRLVNEKDLAAVDLQNATELVIMQALSGG